MQASRCNLWKNPHLLPIFFTAGNFFFGCVFNVGCCICTFWYNRHPYVGCFLSSAPFLSAIPVCFPGQSRCDYQRVDIKRTALATSFTHMVFPLKKLHLSVVTMFHPESPSLAAFCPCCVSTTRATTAERCLKKDGIDLSNICVL